MLTCAPEHLLKNYKSKYFLENCVIYFLKVKKVFFSMQNLTLFSTFSSFTSAPGTPVNKTLYYIIFKF